MITSQYLLSQEVISYLPDSQVVLDVYSTISTFFLS